MSVGAPRRTWCGGRGGSQLGPFKLPQRLGGDSGEGRRSHETRGTPDALNGLWIWADLKRTLLLSPLHRTSTHHCPCSAVTGPARGQRTAIHPHPSPAPPSPSGFSSSAQLSPSEDKIRPVIISQRTVLVIPNFSFLFIRQWMRCTVGRAGGRELDGGHQQGPQGWAWLWRLPSGLELPATCGH